MAALLTLLACGCAKPPPADLPAIPELNVEQFPLAVRQQLGQAYAAVTEEPLDADANGYLGMLLRLYEQPGEAEVFLQRAHSLKPERFQWLYYLAELKAYQGDHALAEQLFHDALALKPDNAGARIQLGEALLNQGKLDEAMVLYKALVADHPTFGEGHYGVGRVLLQQGDAEGAIAALLRTMAITGPFGRGFYLLGTARRQLGQQEQARTDLELYERYRDVAPAGNDRLMGRMQSMNRSDQPLVKLANQAGARGHIDEAIKLLQRAIELNPDSLAAHTSLVGVYGSQGEFDLAERHYRTAAAIDPGVAKLQYNLGVARLTEKRLVEARDAFTRAIEINPQDADSFAQLGLTYEMQALPDKAAEQYRKALEVEPAHRQSHWQLGRLLNAQQRHAEAAEHLHKAVEPADRASPMIRRELAQAQLAMDQKEQAIATLKTALVIAGDTGNRSEAVLIRRDLRELGADPQ